MRTGRATAVRGRATPPDFAVQHRHRSVCRPLGLRRPARRPRRTPLAASRTCSIRMRSKCPRCSMAPQANAASMRCRWVAVPFMSMSGRACWSSAGLTLDDIPEEWEAFWPFWCDQVQPAVREALGRDDIWGVGLPMSARAVDTDETLLQFELAYGAPLVTATTAGRHRRPEVRRRLIKAIDAYTADLPQGLHAARRGDVGPASTTTRQFLAQTVIMTPNATLSIPNALKPSGRTTTTRMQRRSTGRTVPMASRSSSMAS